MSGLFSKLFGSNSKVISLTSKEFWERYNNDKSGVLIDVRTKDEHNQIKIPKSKLIDIYSPNFIKEIAKLDINGSYYIYCRSGGRSINAANEMSKLGITKIYNLAGGISRWDGPTE